jgi:hypothetical protein
MAKKHIFSLAMYLVITSSLLGFFPIHVSAETITNKPWEIGNGIESFVPYIFYSSPAENQQVMAMDIAYTEINDQAADKKSKRRYAIQHVIYPTLGNPNLFDRSQSAPEDELIVSLRFNKEVFQGLVNDGILIKEANTDSYSESFTINSKQIKTLKTKVFFQLFSRVTSKATTIVPSKMVRHLHPTEIDENKYSNFEFKALNYEPNHSNSDSGGLVEVVTLEAKFSKKDIAGVAAGLYDLKVNSLLSFNETQFNAIRIFDEIPNGGKYTIVNITDTQVTVEYKGERKMFKADGSAEPIAAVGFNKLSETVFEEKTRGHLKKFVEFINKKVDECAANSNDCDPKFKNAAFISFNGDLHDGGSPLTVDAAGVADTYNREASVVLNELQKLKLPIVLTTGNHDGYVTMLSQFTQLNSWRKHLDSLKKQFSRSGEGYWFGMEISARSKQIDSNEMPITLDDLTEQPDTFPSINNPPGGLALDIFNGNFAKDPGNYDNWFPVPVRASNVALFDGFNQWRKTYGPLYSSFRFGKNYFLNINSYDLRQFRRSGWGMYTVNYGGNISAFQMDWINRQISKASSNNLDVIVLSHHDPRGGHRGQDFPYAFEQVDFNGANDSLLNYVKGEVLNPQVCKVPNSVKSNESYMNCTHDGLQEWMQPDPLFDCPAFEKDSTSRKCLNPKFKSTNFFSAFAMLKTIAQNPSVRTMLLGHTHYNSVEIKQASDFMIPARITVDQEQINRILHVESKSIMRNKGFQNRILYGVTYIKDKIVSMVDLFKIGNSGESNNKDGVASVSRQSLWGFLQGGEEKQNQLQEMDLSKLGYFQASDMQIKNKELVVLRMTSGADLADQKIADESMIGFAVFEMNQQGNSQFNQISKVNYYQYRTVPGFWNELVSKIPMASGNKDFIQIGNMNLDRSKSLPITRLEALMGEDSEDKNTFSDFMNELKK